MGGTATVENSIFANNKDMDCQLENGMNYSTSDTYSTDHTCAGLIEPDPKLVPFMTNGIFALSPLSPLIDVLPNCSKPDDQRGEPRPMGTACDPGAYEFPMILLKTVLHLKTWSSQWFCSTCPQTHWSCRFILSSLMEFLVKMKQNPGSSGQP